MDAAPSSELEDAIRQIAQGVQGVIALEKCFIRKMGFAYYVDLHVTVDGALSVRHGHDIARQVKQTIRTSYPNVAEVLVHIEPSDLLNERVWVSSHSAGGAGKTTGEVKARE